MLHERAVVGFTLLKAARALTLERGQEPRPLVLPGGRVRTIESRAHTFTTSAGCQGAGENADRARTAAPALKPKRTAISEKLRGEMYEAQGHRCAICDGELRCGEDHGDHADILRDQVAGQRQRFRLLCATCNYAVCDAGQRREGEILKSHYSQRRQASKTRRSLFQLPGAGRRTNTETCGTSM